MVISGDAPDRVDTPPRPGGEPAKPSWGIPGRYARVLHPRKLAEPPREREVSDPGEAAAVRSGWLLVDMHERLSTGAIRLALGHENELWYRYAEENLVELKHPSGMSLKSHESKANKLRYRRTMDFAREGDRIFDVGFGQGYLAAQLLRGVGVASYHGIDLVDTFVGRCGRLFAANGLEDADIQLEIGDLFDLTRERVEAAGASLVICCEVLEHVPDPERALRVLADALPDGAELVFSVPLHGRIENIWGHLTVFDVARLKSMVEQAGLYVHHVEPLANVWSFVVVSRSPERSERVAEAARRPAVSSAVPLSRTRDFVPVPAASFELVPDAVAVKDEYFVACSVSPYDKISFPVEGLEALRLAFEFRDFDAAKRVVVTAKAGEEETGRWWWKVPAGHGSSRKKHAFSLRPGELTATFVSEAHKNLLNSDRVIITVETDEDAEVAFDLRAAYLP
ncbi:2-polyprenyl-3-methyl-5-hydroxy-6-metoxy-1,4-benzoquinol methylase [Naumannella cuiyingiana]|uniref:2-polyprenyl-3-methyl-5-hydroxy-6-metoxy-1, 4-benzoquinol methylase n=1 Tax=Naumannella cuiyingiana TaxID=1347891 RepID=A0A7Z0ILC0_9ACTN|nr:class I SAM-dependent methyltransferase [Naumannella cuiyingiana]NYI71448.1 2-polyprenyl-3-methyl-5-hydroxy-6-metoxy-1,4-benzoquinol methylase [Naumannella cuiyingiana]